MVRRASSAFTDRPQGDSASIAVEPHLLDSVGAAEFLGVTVSVFERNVEPELGRVKIGSQFRYVVRDLVQWADAHRTAAPALAQSAPEFMTTGETAACLRIHRRTLSRWEREGRIQGAKLTPTKQGRRLFARAEVERFLRAAKGV